MANRVYAGERWWVEGERSQIECLYRKQSPQRPTYFVIALADREETVDWRIGVGDEGPEEGGAGPSGEGSGGQAGGETGGGGGSNGSGRGGAQGAAPKTCSTQPRLAF